MEDEGALDGLRHHQPAWRGPRPGQGPAPTRTERHLSGQAAPSVTPVDAFLAARRRFLRGERLEMRDLAAELGIGRATLYRWVGSRERLLGEILWSLAELGLKEAVESTSANGVARVLHVYERLLRLTAAHTPTRRFVENEPEAALRILMSREGVQQGRLIQALQGLLEDAEADGNLRLRLDAADLAYVMVRIAESFIWREFITGEEPDLSTPVAVVRLLLG